MMFSNAAATLSALDRSLGIIEFDLDGTIITANPIFLAALGYEAGEVRGRHHSMFVEPAERDGGDYRAFWTALRRGEFQSGEFRRIAKGGREVWIQATYTPVLGLGGRPIRVIKIASDVTARKLRDAECESRLAAIGRSQGVIEFDLHGHVITANENFLSVLGYRLDEIVRHHHRLFVDVEEAAGQSYDAFWQALTRGEPQSREFRRIAKNGRDVWIQASYNPVLDPSGKPIKVVKFASDVTAQKLRNLEC